jgi:hypothetical protein
VPLPLEQIVVALKTAYEELLADRYSTTGFLRPHRETGDRPGGGGVPAFFLTGTGGTEVVETKGVEGPFAMRRRTADLPLLGQAEQNNDEVHAGSKRATEDEGA